MLLAHVSRHTAGCTPVRMCVRSATRPDECPCFRTCKKANLRMIITLLSAKGGVGKSTSAIHIATYLQSLAPTLLVDGDGIRSATKWSQRGDGKGLPFRVVSYAELAR